jgi:hypothetical protein
MASFIRQLVRRAKMELQDRQARGDRRDLLVIKGLRDFAARLLWKVRRVMRADLFPVNAAHRVRRAYQVQVELLYIARCLLAEMRLRERLYHFRKFDGTLQISGL